MGMNDNDITTLKGAYDGPSMIGEPVDLGHSPTPADIPAILALFQKYLGEVSTDGVDLNESADATDIQVWSGRTVRTTYTNWKSTVVERFVGKLDPDLSRAVYGNDNVTVSGNDMVEAHGLRQPPIVGRLIKSTADNGDQRLILIPRAQLDINSSETWNATDLVVKELTWNALADAYGFTTYEITIGSSAS